MLSMLANLAYWQALPRRTERCNFLCSGTLWDNNVDMNAPVMVFVNEIGILSHFCRYVIVGKYLLAVMTPEKDWNRLY